MAKKADKTTSRPERDGRESARSYQAYRRRRRSRALLTQSCLGVLIVALLFGVSYATVQLFHGRPALPALTSQARAGEAPPGGADAASSQPSVSDAPVSAAMPAAPASGDAWDTAAPLPGAHEGEPLAQDARLLAVPANGRLTNEYFRTVLFIGDSLSQGFALYEPTRGVAAVCAYKSTGPNQVLQNYIGQRPDGTRIEMWDEINIQTPGNIYLLFGTNALLQQSDEAFLKYYGDLMDKLRERFAGVPIYVQSITPTTAEQGVKQPPLENSHIRAVNNEIARLVREKGLYYIDAQEALADETGALRAEYVGTYDGIHMNPAGYAAWADYILTHTVYSAANAAYLAEGPYA